MKDQYAPGWVEGCQFLVWARFSRIYGEAKHDLERARPQLGDARQGVPVAGASAVHLLAILVWPRRVDLGFVEHAVLEEEPLDGEGAGGLGVPQQRDVEPI